jgi:Tol biopolymer transport system component
VVKRLLVAAVGVFLLSSAPGAGGERGQSRIAFGLVRGGLSGDLTSLYTVYPDGSHLRRLTVPPTRQGLGGDSGPAWAPHGRRLVFERNLPYWGNDRMRLLSVPARGGPPTVLTAGPFDAMPAVSPDGRRIAFTRVVGSTAALFTVDRLGRHLAPLLSGGIDLSVAWSPNGRTIAFSRLSSADRPIADGTLYLADVDGSNARRLGDVPVHGVSPAWSPDGQRLAFVSFADGNDPPCPIDACPPSGELYVIGADGTGLRRLTRSRADDQHPTWSPDGRRIGFASGFALRRQGHAPWLMVIRPEGGRAARIGRFAGVVDPSWSPGGVR